MKVIFVIDSISDITKKIEKIRFRFGDNIIFVVKADLVPIFKTYNHTINGIYKNNLSSIVNSILLKSQVDDIVVYYSSLNIDDNLLQAFTENIKDKSKIVNLMPQYNKFERMHNYLYNQIYVKMLFKNADNMACPKLQFIPQKYAVELVASHFSNRLFQNNVSTNVPIENKDINKTAKTKQCDLSSILVPIIIALIITIGLLVTIVNFKTKYFIILIFVFLYLLDIALALIWNYKIKFDNRFLK